MKAKDYRKYLADSEEEPNKLRDLEFIGSYIRDENQKIIKKGFFNLYHGKKESEKDYIKSLIEIAEDGQAIYEFLQNAVDANASEFFIFYDEKYFLVINNGNKFKKDEIESVLNISQSTKSNDISTIGKFGIGFKLVHRLVGENSGLDEIERYCGPILFSWGNNYINGFLNKDFSYVDENWLFKILYTNFPCGANEKIKGVKYEEITPFSQEELHRMIDFVNLSIKKYSINSNTLKEGSLFFLELGKGKYKLLKKEEKTIKNGISLSIKIIQEYQEKTRIKKITINDINVTSNEDISSICGNGYIFIYPNCIREALNYFRKNDSEKVSFFKFFPMESQVNSLNFVLHSEKFDIQANRRELHETPKNVKLLNEISCDLITKFDIIKNDNKDLYIIILINLYLSDLEKANYSDFIQTNLTRHLWCYIKKNIPTADFEFIGDNKAVKIIRSTLDIPLKKHKKFFSFKNNIITKKAKCKLNIQEWNIIDALSHDDLDDWVKTLSLDEYSNLMSEINLAENLGEESFNCISDKKIFKVTTGEFKSANEIEQSRKVFYKGFFEQNIEETLYNKLGFNFTVINLSKYTKLNRFLKRPKINPAYFVDEYNYSDICLILDIFKQYKIENFAIVSKDNNYIIDANAKHINIENKKFKHFLENGYKFDSQKLLIPDPFEKLILSFLPLPSYDDDLKKEFIDNDDHGEVIDFIIEDKKELQYYFLDKLKYLSLSNKRYQKNEYEYKVIRLMLQNDDDFIINFKDKIYLDNEKIMSSLISDAVSFKYGKISLKKINNKKYKNLKCIDVSQLKDSFDQADAETLETLIFNFQEENKRELFEEMYTYLKSGERTIGDEEKLKFILYYSLEKNENLLQKYFKSGFLMWDGKNKKSAPELSYKIVANLLDELSHFPEAICMFKPDNFFPQQLGKNYYLSDIDVAINCEKLPESFYYSDNKKQIEKYRQFGLNIDLSLPAIRRKILNNESLKHDQINGLSQEQIVNTIEFLSYKNEVYCIDDNILFKNIRRLFKKLDKDYFEAPIFLPVLLSNNTFCTKKTKARFYISSEQLKSNNKYFKSRLSEEIKSKDIIYFNMIELDEPPLGWELINENDQELLIFEDDIVKENSKKINATITSKTTTDIERNWAIGHEGEKYVFNILREHYGVKVKWNNINANNIREDSGNVDIELRINGKIHKIEVKTTVESSNTNNDLKFFMSNSQFEAATSWGRDTHLIFVVGINDARPKLLYFNFNDEWLNSF